jgi:nicotinamidase/pyrazinamidase
MSGPSTTHEEIALLAVDIQIGFCPGGQLAVSQGDEVVPLINSLARRFRNVILTQDWHPPGHGSFASSHVGRKPFETIDLPYGPQVLWPDHCVQGTRDAEFHRDLRIDHAQLIIRKGHRHEIDSYSAFVEADRATRTGLDGYLRERGITTLYIAGLATDFCVAWSALDARAAGYEVYVVEDACRGIEVGDSLFEAWDRMMAAGVQRIYSHEVAI